MNVFDTTLLNLILHGVGDGVGGRAVELDGTGASVVVVELPALAGLGELLEGKASELDEGLLDDGLVLALSSLHVHHHGDGAASGGPLVNGLAEVGDGGHQA